MRFRVCFQTQKSVEFWAKEWEFDKYDTKTIRCWGSDNKSVPSVDVTFHETPTTILDLNGDTVWPVVTAQV